VPVSMVPRRVSPILMDTICTPACTSPPRECRVGACAGACAGVCRTGCHAVELGSLGIVGSHNASHMRAMRTYIGTPFRSLRLTTHNTCVCGVRCAVCGVCVCVCGAMCVRGIPEVTMERTLPSS